MEKENKVWYMNSIDESEELSKGNKQDRKRQMLYNLTYVKQAKQKT